MTKTASSSGLYSNHLRFWHPRQPPVHASRSRTSALAQKRASERRQRLSRASEARGCCGEAHSSWRLTSIPISGGMTAMLLKFKFLRFWQPRQPPVHASRSPYVSLGTEAREREAAAAQESKRGAGCCGEAHRRSRLTSIPISGGMTAMVLWYQLVPNSLRFWQPRQHVSDVRRTTRTRGDTRAGGNEHAARWAAHS